MLKRLLLIWIFSGSLDSFSQDKPEPLYLWPDGKLSVLNPNLPVINPDTLRAELLVTYTTRRWGIAHARDGYVVRKDGKVIRFLTDKKERFPPNTRLWGWVDVTEKILP